MQTCLEHSDHIVGHISVAVRGAPVVVEGEDAERGDESVLEPLHAVPADVRHLVRDQAEQERHCEMNNTSLFTGQLSLLFVRLST